MKKMQKQEVLLKDITVSVIWNPLGGDDRCLDLARRKEHPKQKKHSYLKGRKKTSVSEMWWIREIREKEKIEN